MGQTLLTDAGKEEINEKYNALLEQKAREKAENVIILEIATKYGLIAEFLGYSDLDKWVAIVAREYAADYTKRVIAGKCFDCPANHHFGANT